MKKACKTLLICILAILILALAQTLALLAGEASVKAGLPGIFEPVIDAVLYPVLAFFGLCHVGPGPDPDSVFTLVINTKNSLISGGNFGVESSIIAIAGYAIVSVIAFVLGRKCGEDRRRSC